MLPWRIPTGWVYRFSHWSFSLWAA